MKIIIKPSNLFDKILLNFRCKEGTVSEGSYACEATDLKSKKKYDKEYKEKVTPLVSKLTEKLASMNARQAELHKFFTTPPNGMTYSLHYNTPQFKAWKESPEVKAAEKEYRELTEPILDTEKELAYLNYNHPLVTPEFKQMYDNSYKILQEASIPELKALDSYMDWTSKPMNGMLRDLFPNGEPMPPNLDQFTFDMKYGYAEQHASKLDSLVNKNKTPNDLILYSGISSSVYNGTIPEIKDVGAEIKYSAFMSTSRSEKVAQQFASVRMKKGEKKPTHAEADMPTYLEIHLKSGSRALSIERFQAEESPDAEWTATKKANQQEVILGRNVIHTVRDVQIQEIRGKPVRKIILDSESVPMKTYKEFANDVRTELKNILDTEAIEDPVKAESVARENSKIIAKYINVPMDPIDNPFEDSAEIRNEAMRFASKKGAYGRI